MHQTLSHIRSFRSSRQLSLLIKLVVVLGFVTLFYYQIIVQDQISEVWQTFKLQLVSAPVWSLALVLLLMPINWLLESEKWRRLLRSNIHLSNIESLKAVLCGLSFGVITPQRVGEYGGRAITLPDGQRWSSVVATFYSSIAQNISNLILGAIGISVFSMYYLDVSKYVLIAVLGFCMAAIAVLVFIYFNLAIFKNAIPVRAKTKVISWLKLPKKSGESVSEVNLISALCYSLLRSSIYISQYILILHFFGVNAEILALASGVATIYLLQSSIPLPPLFGILARGEIALLVWGIFNANELSILSATFSLWFINLLIPAFLGIPILLRANILNDNKPA